MVPLQIKLGVEIRLIVLTLPKSNVITQNTKVQTYRSNARVLVSEMVQS